MVRLKKKGDYSTADYDRAQRAFVLKNKKDSAATKLDFEILADDQSPVINPVFVIENWGQVGAYLRIGDRKLSRGKDFRFGHRHTLKGSDLIVWLGTEFTKPIKI